jgi:hypothetical protein
MKDIEIFHLHRSRIPTPLFRQIVQDIDIMLVQYGPPAEHETQEATSQFVSPVSILSCFSDHQCTYMFHPQIFNHLIAIFGFAFKNRPVSIIEGHFTGVEYYFTGLTICSLPILFMEVNLKTDYFTEKLDVIAQVMAECNGKTYFFVINFKG